MTRGLGALDRIVGTTSAMDVRDAYCLRVVAGFTFQATTDPANDPAATASFDTRLFLFDPNGRAVLANDDTPGGGALSTLTGVATDGSGVTLDENGEYILVVTGVSAVPQDAAALDQFDFSAGVDLVHAADPLPGRFHQWAGAAPATGSYTIGLTGADHCQEGVDALFTKVGEPNRTCRSNRDGGFSFCEAIPDTAFTTEDGALGYLGLNPHLDAVFANGSLEQNRVCTGSRGGLTFCVSVLTSSVTTYAVALGDIDGDRNADALFGSSAGPNQLCLGDGGGLFSSCDAFFNPTAPNGESRGIALGYLDADAHLDVVVANDGTEDQVCLGDGAGGLDDCSPVSADVFASRAVALGFVDGDQHLDAVFANQGSANRLCLGDGSGGFVSPCSAVDSGGANRGVALGLVDADEHLDAVFAHASGQVNRVCLGNGTGSFTCSNVSADADTSQDVALGYSNDDSHLDAVFAGEVDSLCFGDGTGGFSCSDLVVGGSGAASTSVALGNLYEHPFFEDSFESGTTGAWSSSTP